MTGVARLLAWRSLWDRPRRTVVLLVGYGLGVAVMIALLSVGEALLGQARDRDLVAGGDVVLLPEGVDPDVLKVNAVTDLGFTIQQPGFIIREFLRGPRFRQAISAAAPEIDARQLYVRARGRIHAAIASAGIPSLDRAARATASVPGARDSDADRAWTAPTAQEQIDHLDRFHRPPAGAGPAWAEWDYFNFADPTTGVYGYLTLLAGAQGRGGVLIRIKRPGQPVEDVTLRAVIKPGHLSYDLANQRIGPARLRTDAGRYHVTVDDPHARVDLWVTPVPGYYLPAGEVSTDTFISGYVVPAVRGRADGQITTARGSLRLADAPAYHDHNWGTWRGVTWEWGEVGGTGGAVLYGALHVPEGQSVTPSGRPPVLFLWGPSREGGGGFLGPLQVRTIGYGGWHLGPTVRGRRVRAPAAVTIDAGSGASHVTVSIQVQDALASAAQEPDPSTQPSGPPSHTPGVAFLQMRGVAEVRGAVDGHAVIFTGQAAAETFVPLR